MADGFPHRPKNLRITVKVNYVRNGVQESVETDLFCDKGNCGKGVDIYGNGPNTIHNVVCTEHGLLTSFANYEALKKFTELCANKILADHGHGTITEKTECIPVDDPKSVN
jgi:hypothetical protein